jgi:hypothetical protein
MKGSLEDSAFFLRADMTLGEFCGTEEIGQFPHYSVRC